MSVQRPILSKVFRGHGVPGCAIFWKRVARWRSRPLGWLPSATLQRQSRHCVRCLRFVAIATRATARTISSAILPSHKAVVAASGNQAMIEIYEFFSASIRETIEATLCDELPEPDMQAHADIIDAIASGSPDQADAATRRFMAPILSALDRMLLS